MIIILIGATIQPHTTAVMSLNRIKGNQVEKSSLQPKLLALLMAGLSCYGQAWAVEPKTTAISQEQAEAIDDVTVIGKRLSQDEKGAAAVFRKNVANDYLGKDYLDRYQVNAAGDVLKGLNGVYNMNTRTAGGAITPNIRGVTGKGRIPVTIDGTEQTVDVWLNNYGVGDRNYVDPALFRSITVEKSPSLTRGMKPGVGGSIAIRTIEPSDIIPEGKSWGVQLSGELSNNATKSRSRLGEYLGWSDYRTLPGGATADGAGGGYDPYTNQITPQALLIDDDVAPKASGGSKFGDDKSGMLAAAFATEHVDGLIAYSHRNKGNYFAGSRGAGGYRSNPIYELDGCGAACQTADAFIPNMAKIYAPGGEVFNSGTETKTLLAKNNWQFGDGHKLGLQYMRNDIEFGEINPFQMTWELNFDEYNAYMADKRPPQQLQGINSKIKSDTYKLSYDFKPDDNPWVDLQFNLWRTQTRSQRHQSGGMNLASAKQDPMYDAWHWCNVRNRLPPGASAWAESCADVGAMWGFDANTSREDIIKDSYFPNDNGQYAVIAGALQQTKVTRSGADISNRFRLSDQLSMTVSADVQYEKLREQNLIRNSDDLFNMEGMVTGLTNMAGPRGGRRKEWGGSISFDWQPTPKLNVQAGLRYQKFWAFDDALDEARANKDPRYAFGGGRDIYISGVQLPYYELMGEEEAKDWDVVVKADQAGNAETYGSDAWHAAMDRRNELDKAFTEKYQYDNTYYNLAVKTNGNLALGNDERAYYKIKKFVVPYRNGKLDSSVVDITPEMLDRKVNNPQGQRGAFYEYLITDIYSKGGHCKPSQHNGQPLGDYETCKAEARKQIYRYDSRDNVAGVIQTPISEEQKWQRPQKLRGDAWAPMLALSYDVTEQQRLFARYAQMTRFPSIYEATATEVGVSDTITTPGMDLKPERSISWEVGYAFDFSPYVSALQYGDVRLTYFSNTIKNVLDTTADKRITQYDKKISKGLELQSRLDSGRFFASLGATYRLKQVTCDRDLAFSYDPYLRRVPNCIEGGFGATRFYQALQPKYSVNLDLGTRLMNDRLSMGVRGIYHSSVDSSAYEKMMQSGFGDIMTTTGKPYHWRSVFLTDLYGRYDVTKNVSVNVGVTNLTNRYYLDPMSNVPTPGPGRTVTFGLKGSF